MYFENWISVSLRHTDTVRDAINNLNSSGLRIVVVVDDDSRLLGTVSDGDVRRALLNNFTIDALLVDVMNTKPKTAEENISRRQINRLMIEKSIDQLPILNQDGVVTDLAIRGLMETRVEQSNLVVIMAGGKGERLRPLTEKCPKPMLVVNGKPILLHVIEKFRVEGFSNFAISVNYLGDVIEEFFGDGSKFDVEITYIRESNPLGTAGSLSLLNTQISKPMIVVNGDVLTDLSFTDMLDYHNELNALGTMGVRQYEWQNPFGVVTTEGPIITSIEEKPTHRANINAGVYVLDPNALKCLVVGEYCDMPELFWRIRDKGDLIAAYPIHEKWNDVGSAQDLKDVSKSHELGI